MVFGIEMEKIPTETAKISFMQLKVHEKVFQSVFDLELLHFSVKTANSSQKWSRIGGNKILFKINSSF